MKKYLFYLESYSLLSVSSNNILIYNFLSSQTIKIKRNIEINQIISSWSNPNNLYCAELTEKDLLNNNICELINNTRKIFCGDIIDITLIKKKPIFLKPELNLQKDITRLRLKSDREIGNNILGYLHQLTIYLNIKSINLSFSSTKHLFHSIITSTINKITICGNNVFDYPHIHELIDELDRMSVIKTFCVTSGNVPEDIKSLGFLKSEQFRLRIEVPVGFNVSKIEKLSGQLSKEKINHEWEFSIVSEETYEQADAFIEKLQLENTEIKPVFTGDNLKFFEDNIYLSEEDLQSPGLSKREVFAHQALNTNDFGKLTVTPDGKVYANLNHEPLGTIEDDIRELIYKEMDKGTSWRRIRDMKPCCNCVYQWLCPSPSNYELAIGKPNLCHVKP